MTVVSAMPRSQAHLWVFQLSAALAAVTEWGSLQSDLVKTEDRLLFKHLRALLFDVLTSVRLGAGGRAMQQLSEKVEGCTHP